MSNTGFSHVGLSTLDLDKTREFYENVLGFKVVIADTIKIKEGGTIRHIFFDTGRDQRWPSWNRMAFQEFRWNKTPATIAASAPPPPSITSPSKPDPSRGLRTSVGN